MTAREFLLADLAEHGSQSSWDWDADRRWARFVGDRATIADIDKLMESDAIGMVRVNYHDVFVRRQATLPRLRALRRLVRSGEVRADWQSAGEGSRSLYGVGRIRVYRLV